MTILFFNLALPSSGYVVLGGSSENAQRQYAGDEEDLLLQYAIRQSLDTDTASEQVGKLSGLCHLVPVSVRFMKDHCH